MEKQVISIIERVTGEVYPDANENSNVILDFGLDSLQMVTLFLNLEDEFEVSFDFDLFDFEILKSISSLVSSNPVAIYNLSVGLFVFTSS